VYNKKALILEIARLEGFTVMKIQFTGLWVMTSQYYMVLQPRRL